MTHRAPPNRRLTPTTWIGRGYGALAFAAGRFRAYATVGTGEDDRVAGIALILLFTMVIPLMDVMAKAIAMSVPPGEIAVFRYLAGFLLTLPFVLRHGGMRAIVALPQPGLQIVRAVLVALASVFFFWAITYMPIADAMALIFIEPVIVTVLSAILLRERVGIRRWTAVLVGFVGVVVMLKPGADVLNPGTPLALAAALMFSFYLILTRHLKGHVPPLVAANFMSLVGCLAMAVLVTTGTMLGDTGAFHWVAVDGGQLLWMLCLGAIGTVGHVMLIAAFERAPVSVLAPLGYFELVTATLYGFLAFGELPGRASIIGGAIVIAAGLYITIRESRLAGSDPSRG